jgi:predicted O-methyltransferase YrrM
MKFTHEWFYRQRPQFEKHLLPLEGKPLKCLEIGSFEGESACFMLEKVLTHQDSHLTCIDPWGEELPYSNNYRDKMHLAYELFLENTKEFKKLTTIRGYSHQELPKLTQDTFDFIYVDGSHKHTDCLEDMILSWRLLKSGGIMAVDDYEWKDISIVEGGKVKGPKLAIDTFLALWDCEIIELGWVAFLRKK